MLADPFLLPVVDGSDTTEKTESAAIISMSGNSVIRRIGPLTWDDKPIAHKYPSTLKISHTTSGKGSKRRVRHLCRFDTDVEVDGVIADKPASLYLVADIPDEADDLSTVKAALWQRMTGILYGASAVTANSFDLDTFYNRWLNGES